jgi:hypothetical protein
MRKPVTHHHTADTIASIQVSSISGEQEPTPSKAYEIKLAATYDKLEQIAELQGNFEQATRSTLSPTHRNDYGFYHNPPHPAQSQVEEIKMREKHVGNVGKMSNGLDALAAAARARREALGYNRHTPPPAPPPTKRAKQRPPPTNAPSSLPPDTPTSPKSGLLRGAATPSAALLPVDAHTTATPCFSTQAAAPSIALVTECFRVHLKAYFSQYAPKKIKKLDTFVDDYTPVELDDPLQEKYGISLTAFVEARSTSPPPVAPPLAADAAADDDEGA